MDSLAARNGARLDFSALTSRASLPDLMKLQLCETSPHAICHTIPTKATLKSPLTSLPKCSLTLEELLSEERELEDLSHLQVA